MDVIVLANIITSILKTPCLMRPFSEFPSIVTIDKFDCINKWTIRHGVYIYGDHFLKASQGIYWYKWFFNHLFK